MKVVFEDFEKLTSKQVEDAFRLRQQVFIVEQDCFYEDIDGYDDKASHLLMYDGESLAGYLRLFRCGVKYAEEASLGRIVVASEYRGTGLGPRLIKKGIELCKGEAIRIEAQAALKGYYTKLGFQEEGDIYPVDGIDHLQMTLR